MSTESTSTKGIDHPLKIGKEVVYSPPTVLLDNLEGTIKADKMDELWGAIYRVQDEETDHIIPVGQDSIIETVEEDKNE